MTKALSYFNIMKKSIFIKKEKILWMIVKNELKNFQSLIVLSLLLILKYNLQWTTFILSKHNEFNNKEK